MDKIDKLVEWVAQAITGFGCGIQASWDGCGDCEGLTGDQKCQGSLEIAKQILSHPDLALIDRDWYHKYKDGTADASIIPLAEALKETDEDKSFKT